MSKYLVIKAAIGVAFLLSVSNLYAESSLDASVTGSASGDSKDNELELGASADYQYNTKQVFLSSNWQSYFSSDSGFSSIDNWQTDNLLKWTSTTQRVSSSFGYVHAETDRSNADLVKSDNLQSQLIFTLPISLTVSHAFTATAEYDYSKNSTSANKVDDWSGSGEYNLRWSPARGNSITGTSSYKKYDSGSSIKTVELAWQRAVQPSVVSASISKSWTEDGEDESALTGGSIAYNRNGQYFNFSMSVSRSQTDALSFFDAAFDTNPIEQQSQLVVDTLTISLSEIELTAKNLLELSYQIGRSETLSELNNQSDRYDVTYSQVDILGRRLLSSNSIAEANYRTRTENSESDSTQELELRYQNQLNRHWDASASISHDLKNDSSLSWSVSLTYKL